MSCEQRADVGRRARASAPWPGARRAAGLRRRAADERLPHRGLARGAHRRRRWPTRRRWRWRPRATGWPRAHPPSALRSRRARRSRRWFARSSSTAISSRATLTSTSSVPASTSAAADFADRLEQARAAACGTRAGRTGPAPARGPSAPISRSAGTDVELAVEAQAGHLAVEEHPLARLTQVLPLLRRQVVEVLEDPFEVAVGGDELRRGLLADAGHAGQVVARVAAQRRVVGVLRGRDAGALDDPGLVVERVVGDAAAVVEHLDVRVVRRAGSCRGRR